MICGNPLLNERAKLVGLLQELCHLRLRHHLGRVIVEDVSLAPARIKVGSQVRNTGPQGKLDGFKGGLVMPRPNDTVPRTGNGHFGKLEDRVIGCGKLAVRREARDARVFEVTPDYGTQAVKFPAAGGVCLDLTIVQ
jgi:hypothetical protein